MKKIIRFFRIFSFWVFIYTLLVIIHLQLFGIGVGSRPYVGESIFIAFIEFLFVMLFLIYSPLYLLPFLLTKGGRLILPIVLSLLVFSLHGFLTVFVGLVAHDIDYPIELLPVSLVFQVLGVIVISYIYTRGQENTILPKITKFIFIFLLGAVIYFLAFGLYASQLPSVIEDLTQQAVETENPSLCERIKSVGEKRWKIFVRWEEVERCFEKIIKKTNGSEVCDRVEGSTARDRCFKSAALFLNNSQLCERIRTNVYRDKCFQGLAQKLDNPQLCGRIDIDFINADCFEALALQLNDKELCEKTSVYYPGRVKICLEKIAQLNNPELCEKTANRYECFRDVAVYSKNPQLCEKIGDPSQKYSYGWQDTCFESLAFRLNNSQLCERIIKEERRSKCLEKLEGEIPEIRLPERIVGDETANWETLKSTYLGFEIKYPYDWGYSEEGGTPHFYSPAKTTEGPPPIAWRAVIWLERTGVQTIEEFITDRFGPTTNNKIISDSTISLNSLNGREIIYTCKDCKVKYIPETDIYIPDDEGRVILISKDSDTFIIWFYYYRDDPRATDYLGIFNQMLLTFRFLE